MKSKFFIALMYLSLSVNSFAQETLSFPKIWENVAEKSPQIKSILFNRQSSEQRVNRLSRYWMPTLYFNSQVIYTNAPVMTFMNYLGQGQVKQDDFYLTNLNSPADHIFHSSEIGVNLLVYDGHASKSNFESQKHFSAGLNYEKKVILLKQYIATLKEYSELLLMKNYQDEILTNKSNIQNIMKNYHVGEKSNPIGYSGLLGLKSLQNKLNYLEEETKNKFQSAMTTINILAGNQDRQWIPIQISFDEFIKTYYLKPSQTEQTFEYLAEIEKSKSMEEKISGERGKYLPKLGIFSQADIYDGKRGSKASYMVGASLKFNFQPSDYGSADEIELLAESKSEEANSVALANTLSKKVSQDNINSLQNRINFMEDDEKLTDEQINVLMKLFSHGSLNISQIAPLLNKKIDLIANKYSLKELLVRSRLEVVSLTNKSVDPRDIWSLK